MPKTAVYRKSTKKLTIQRMTLVEMVCDDIIGYLSFGNRSQQTLFFCGM